MRSVKGMAFTHTLLNVSGPLTPDTLATLRLCPTANRAEVTAEAWCL